MILPLTLLLLAAPPNTVRAPAQGDPAVKVWLNSDRIEPGSWARVQARLADDGYLLVLAADPAGNVRVLFPLDPGADAFVRAGRTVDVRGRGNRGSFLVGEAGGAGVVLAARTAEPLRLAGFVRGDHWDYAALDSAAHGPTAGQSANPDELLLGLAQQLAGGNQLDYDAATYTVDGGVAAADRAYTQPAYIDDGWGYGYGYPYGYGCYDPWSCGSFFFAGFGFGLFYSPFVYRPFYYPFIGRPVIVRPGYAGVTGYRNRAYIGSRYISTARAAQYRTRGAAGGARPYAATRSGPRSAPRFSGPRMAAPSFRGGRGGRGGGGGGRRGR
ncbi:MAG: DUF4384 domain-containing protein [Gemmatimonadales bacterium]|jgi:hypothetical protein